MRIRKKRIVAADIRDKKGDRYIHAAIVLDNDREVRTEGKITYMPIYYIMSIERLELPTENCIF